MSCKARQQTASPEARATASLAGGRGDLDATLDRFVDRLKARLAAGAATYGDESFRRPAAELIDEVQQEIEDVCGWSLILWTRLERLRERIDALGTEGANRGHA